MYAIKIFKENKMSENLNISIIQAELIWENKEANLQKFSSLFASVASETHIIVLPEMCSTGFSMNVAGLAEPMDGPTFQWFKEQAMGLKKIITGSFIVSEDGKYFNRMIWMMPNGEYYFYDKKHLFAKADEHHHFTAGNKKLMVQVNGWKILLQVCYDLRFPVWARQAEQEYDVLINVANWPEVRMQAWTTLLRARAIENQAYVIGCNVTGTDGNQLKYSGNSAAIDFLGNTLWEAVHEEAVANISLSKDDLNNFRSQYPFLNDRDQFMILPDSES